MGTKIFVNLPVSNVERSTAFYTALGYSPNPQFSDTNATCMVIADDIYVMVLAEPFFKSFTKKEIADAARFTEVIVAFGLDSREQVDTLADAALKSGGSPANDTSDEGFMYTRSFYDPDGHLWEVFYMNPDALQQDQEVAPA